MHREGILSSRNVHTEGEDTLSKRLLITMTLVGLLGLSTFGATLAAATTIQVRAADVGTSWFTGDTRTGGTVDFASGPVTPPLGAGSLMLVTTDAFGSSQAKAQLFNYDYIGTRLADIDALSFDAYRDGSSTNSAVQTISINIEVDFTGDGSSYTTLVWEPVYNTAQGAISNDSWQSWDAYASGAGIWWSSRDIPGVCAFNCFVSWENIITANPNAQIIGGFGFNIGSGWAGEFVGYADALTIGVEGDSVTYDFEPKPAYPTSQNDCKDGGWKDYENPSFKNQGQCVRYVVASNVCQMINNFWPGGNRAPQCTYAPW